MSKLDVRKTRLQKAAGVFILGIAVVIILFSGTANFTQANVGRHLQRFADYVAQQAEAVGKEAKLTYGKLTIESWSFNKHATVDDVSLELADKASPNPVKWVISTAKMLVLPDPVGPNGLIFEFSGPINIAEGGQPKTVVTFPSPLEYVYSDTQTIHGRAITHALRLPKEITFAAVGNENGRVVVDYDASPRFYENLMPDRNQSESVYEFHNVKVTTADGTQVTAAAIVSNFNETQDKDKRLEGKYTLAVSNLVLHDHDKASKAYNLSVNLSSNRTSDTGNKDTTINEMLLTSDNFKVKVTGGVSTSSDDGFPSGNATVDIDNVPQFLASELIPEDARKTIVVALQKISGQPADKLTHATILLKRDKNGALYVGDTTFAALMASVLADMMQTAAPAAAGPEQSPAPAMVAPSPSGSPAPKNDLGQHEKPVKSPQ